MKTIVNMANSTVTGMVLKDVPRDIPKLDSCPSCALMKAQRTPFKDSRMHTMKPLELIHSDLVRPMLVESVGRCKYGLVLMDDYSRASWVLLLRAKSDAPTEFEVWAARMENGMGSTIQAIMFDNAREFVAGQMKEYCNQKGIHINSSVLYSPSSNGVAERLVRVATNGTCAMLHDSALLLHFWAEAMLTFMYLRNQTPMSANDSVMPYERFYGMKLDVSHICTFRCTVRIALPCKKLGKLDDCGEMGYLLGYKYEGGYRVWMPRISVREVRDVVFYEGTVPTLPNHGSTIVVELMAPTPAVPAAMLMPPASTPTPLDPGNGSNDADDMSEMPVIAHEKITIRLPGRYHPCTQNLCPAPADDAAPHIPLNLTGDVDNDVPHYMGKVHQYPTRSTRSRLV